MMQDDVAKIIDFFNNGELEKIDYIPIGTDDFDFKTFFDKKINERLYNEYFRFLDKYRHNYAFFDLLMQQSDEGIFFLRMILPEDYYKDVVNYLAKQDKDSFLENFPVVNKDDLEYAISLGYTVKEIVSAGNMSGGFKEAYLKDRTLASLIATKYQNDSYEVVALDYLNGNKEIINLYFEQNRDALKLLLPLFFKVIVENSNNFDLDSIISSLMLINPPDFNNRINISFFTDNDLIAEMIKKGNSRALIFAKNPTPELVKLASDFSLDDYIFINDEYKKSEDLLMALLNEGHIEALYHAPIEAIGEKVYDYLVNNDIDPSFLKEQSSLDDSYIINKYYERFGDFSRLYKIQHVFTDINAFNFGLRVIREGKFDPANHSWGCELKYLYYIEKKDYDKLDSIGYSYGFSNEVAKKLIEMGITADIFLKFFKYDNTLAGILLEQGHYEVLFKCSSIKDEDLKYIDYLTYEMYLDYREKYGYDNLAVDIFAKFVREGHYEIFLNAHYEYYGLTKFLLRKFGFENLTYEDYQKLPEYVKELPFLKEMFLVHDENYYLDILKTKPTLEALESVVANDMPYEEFVSYLKGYKGMLSSSILIHYLKKGHLDILKYIDDFTFYEKVSFIADEIIKLLNYELPPKNIMKNSYIADSLIRKYIEAKKFAILKYLTFVSDGFISLLIENGYTFEDFLKYPLFSGNVIELFTTKENEERLVNFLEQHLNDLTHVNYSYLVIIKAYKNKYTNENLNKLIKLLSPSVIDILKNIDVHDYVIFDELDFGLLFTDRLVVDSILNYLSLDTIKNQLNSYMNEDIKCYVIEKMVNLGHSECVDYFGSRISTQALKKAILAGYFPSDEVLIKNRYLKLTIKNLKFSEEQLNYLRSRLDKQPLFVIYFPDIVKDLDLIYKYVIQEPRILLYCDDIIKNNQEVLKKIVLINPAIVANVINILDNTLIIELIKLNNELLNYIPLNILSYDNVSAIAKFYPAIIDMNVNKYDYAISVAFEHGYQISSKTTNDVLFYALNNNILIPKEVLLSKDYKDLFDLILYNQKYYKNNTDYINDVLDTLKAKDSNEFLWQLFSYSSTSSKKSGILTEINQYCGTYYSELANLNIENKEQYLFNLLLLDINKLDDENFYKKIYELMDKTPFKYDIITIINKRNANLAFEYAKKYFRDDPLRLIEFIKKIDDEFLPVIKDIILLYPDLVDKDVILSNISRIVDSKEMVLKLFDAGKYSIYKHLSEDFKNDFDILYQYISYEPSLIFQLDSSVERYRDLCLMALLSNPNLYELLDNEMIKKDEEILKAILPKYPSAFIYADSSIQTKENFELITDFQSLNFNNIDEHLFEKIISFNLFNINDSTLASTILDYLLKHQSMLNDELFKNSYIIEVFKNSIDSNFKSIITLFNRFDANDLPEDIRELFSNANAIIKGANKINLLEKTSLLSYDLVKYVYPVMGLQAVLDLLQYNTTAVEQISSNIKDGRSRDVLEYWQFVKEYKLFPNNERLIHFAFMNYNSFRELLKSVLNYKDELNEKDIANLRKIISNNNMYGIKSYSEFKNYEVTVEKHVTEILNGNNIDLLKDNLATLFGFTSVSLMSETFNNFQIDNFAKINCVYEDIRKKYGEDKLNSVKLTTKDIKLILLMKEIIETSNIEEIKELFNRMVVKEKMILDYSDIVEELINKIRKIYNLQFNSRLTDVSSLQSKKMSKDDVNNPYGVTIIKMDGEPFNFLAHRLYNYDASMTTGSGSFSQLLMNDPSLWTRLDGASTLSTSSFSDKGFWFLEASNTNGVVYLFNDLPEDFLLFMYGRDLYVEHGGHRLRPTARSNLFMDIDSLNQSSCYHGGSYNEVAGFRNGMLPCAFACTGSAPNAETIKAAKYFSETLGIDIPIIMFDIPAYDKKKEEEAKKAYERYKTTSSYEDLCGIFYDGLSNVHNERDDLAQKIDFCLNTLKERYYNEEISFFDLLRKIQELELVANRIFAGNNEIRKIQIFKTSLCMLKNITSEEIIKLESANLGESGIMYKFEEEGRTYLVKPAVDKQKLKVQKFRADIQVAASKLQRRLSPETSVPVEAITTQKFALAKQEYLDINQNETKRLSVWAQSGGPIEQKYLDQLLREYVVDFALGNFDAYSGNFVIDSVGNVRGIDKEQSFRFMDNDESLNPDFSYVPNGTARIPIYKIMFERFRNGEIHLNLDIIAETLEKLKGISDKEYRDIFREYAENLGKEQAEDLLDKICERRTLAIEKINEFLQELGYTEEMGGVTL